MYALLGFVGTLLIQGIVAVFLYGRLTERVNTHTGEIEKLKTSEAEHDREIGELYGAAGMRR